MDPTPITLQDAEGVEHKFNIHKFNAVDGREIVSQYPTSGMPIVGQYDTNKRMMLKIMGFVERVHDDGKTIALTTEALVNNHVPGWEMLLALEWRVMEHNCTFFRDGKASGFLEGLRDDLPRLILSMLTRLLERSSQKDSPPSTS